MDNLDQVIHDSVKSKPTDPPIFTYEKLKKAVELFKGPYDKKQYKKQGPVYTKPHPNLRKG